MKRKIFTLGWVLATALFLQAQDPGKDYINAWCAFYPTSAQGEGMHAYLWYGEDRSLAAIEAWLDVNRNLLAQLDDPASAYVKSFPIDARLLRLQAAEELYQWGATGPHRTDPTLYTRLMERNWAAVESAYFLIPQEKGALRCAKLATISQLTAAARNNLQSATAESVQAATRTIGRLLSQIGEVPATALCSGGQASSAKTIEALTGLRQFLEDSLPAKTEPTSPILGSTEYTRQLRQYTDSELTPETLAEMAGAEIELVRGLMLEVAEDYLLTTYPGRPLPEGRQAVLDAALEDMEADAPTDGADYLAFWLDLSARAQQFLQDQEIATLPPFQTLRILPAPESAGPAARIGWVQSAPPFAPNPLTTLYLPSIPDTFPAQERLDFWSSFNKPFNRMIVIHELFPGHYMQIKISRETAHPVRLLFPFRPYFEGWATFVERVCLDAGWEAGNHLTMLAHLRKRMENANRAYTSVMVHCEGWDADQVMEFSTREALLAPQFAKSLWGRLLRGPMQMTSYFWGGRQFTELLEAEKARLGENFILKDFMDTILKAGPVPIDSLYELLAYDSHE